MGHSLLSLLLVLFAFVYTVVGDITTDGLLQNDYNGNFLFVVNDSSEFCLRASFGLELDIHYNQFNLSTNASNTTSSLTDRFPGNWSEVSTMDSWCSRSGGMAFLLLAWNSSEYNNSYVISMNFRSDNNTWALYEVEVNVDFYNKDHYVHLSTNDSSAQFSSTNDTSWFKRTFTTSQYYHCDAGQDIALTLPGDVILVDEVSKVRISRAVIYMGTYSNPTSAPCLEDWIAEQEKIVPIIVGGVLAVLLLLIFIAYTVTFVQRKRKEKLNPQYEQLSGKE